MQNQIVTANFKKIKFSYLIFPIGILITIGICLFSYCNGEDFNCKYPNIQKSLFIILNNFLSEYPSLENNITNLGDVLIIFPLFAYLFVKAPKFWEALISSALVSLVISVVLKKLFSIPRPAATYENSCFHIIGKKLLGHNSLPSGHSITTFFVFTVFVFAFLPKNNFKKLGWFIGNLLLAMFIVSSRVGVGAHYPLDVLIGSILGFITGVLGIIIINKTNWLQWISNSKFQLLFILIFMSWVVALFFKIMKENLLIYYFPIISLIFTLYLMITNYVKSKN